jgi:hypothetical protein
MAASTVRVLQRDQMPEDVRIWQILKDNQLDEVSKTKLELEKRIEQWIERDSSVLSDGVFIIGRQVPTDFGGFIDLLCLADANCVIVELKRDKTPREITAQALDYASWVKDLSTFRTKFSTDLPDVINENHKMIIVTSEIDASSERIIKYLSETYRVAINAATFSYFRTRDGNELLARVFLVPANEIEENARSTPQSKRTNVTFQQLAETARYRGVGALYDQVTEELEGILDRPATRKNSLTFAAKMPDGSTKAILNLLPANSSAEDGLRFQIYTRRLAQFCDSDEAQIESLLPQTREFYEYYPDAPVDLKGWAGYFRDSAEVCEVYRWSQEATERQGKDTTLRPKHRPTYRCPEIIGDAP